MKTRILSILLTAVLIFSLTACGGGKPADPSAAKPDDTKQTEAAKPAESAAPAADTQSVLEPVTPHGVPFPEAPGPAVEIRDQNGGLLGKIDGRASASAADDGVFYSIFALEENRYSGLAEYHFYRFSDGKDLLLGTVENQGYEAFYARTELDGIVYALCLEGDPSDEAPDTLWLLAVNGKEGTMARCAVSHHGFPYAAMAVVNGKLLIMNHEMTDPKCDAVYEFDPAAGSLRQVLSLPASAASEDDSLRGVCADESGFCLLRVHVRDGAPAGLFLDRYDSAYKKTSETDLTGLFVQEAQKIPGVDDGALSEAGMMVAGFRLEGGRYLYYENFAITRLILDLEAGTSVFAANDLFTLTPGGGQPAFFHLEFSEEAADHDVRILRGGSFQQVLIPAADSRAMLQNLTHSPAGSWLALLKDGTGAAPDALIFWQEP